MTPKAQTIKEKIYKSYFIKINTLILQSTLLKESNNKLQTGRKCLQNIYLLKDLYPEQIKILKNQ